VLLIALSSSICLSEEPTLDSLLNLTKANKDNDLNSLELLCSQGIKLSQTLKNKPKLGEFYFYLGYFYHQKGRYPQSYTNLINSLQIFEKIGDEKLLSENYRLLGESNRATGNFDLALEYLDKALVYFKKSNDTIGIASSYNRKAAVFYEISIPDSLLFYALTSNKLLEKYDSVNKIIANNYNILGAFYSNHDKKSAFEYYKKALDILEKRDLVIDKSHIYINIARIYYDEKDFVTAKEYATNAYKIAINKGVNSYISQSSKILSEIYSQLGNFESAYNFRVIYSDLRDSILGAKKTQQIINIQTKFEQEKQLQKISYESNISFYRILILISAIIFFGLIAIVLYIRQKDQVRKNKMLEENNKTIHSQAEKLKELNMNKDLLFSIMAHDLRNPLSTMKLIATMLRDNYESLSENDKLEFVSDIINSTDSANLLIENLLLWSRTQRDLVKVYYELTNPYEIIDILIKIISPSATRKNIKIINNIPKDAEFYTDSNMFSTIIRNLVTNSVKFTERGGRIIIDCVCNKASGIVSFSVLDNGIGMTSEEVQSLFKPGIRFTYTGTEDERGTGLGLLICKDFCTKLNGKLIVESEKKIGSKFTLQLPIVSNPDLV
jgi:signal transduction histidine kinase